MSITATAFSKSAPVNRGSLNAGTDLAAHLRLTISGGDLVAADGSTLCLGTNETAELSGQPVNIRWRNAEGYRTCIAAGEIAAGAVVYAAAGGKVDDSGSVVEGIAVSAAALDGDEIEVVLT